MVYSITKECLETLVHCEIWQSYLQTGTQVVNKFILIMGLSFLDFQYLSVDDLVRRGVKFHQSGHASATRGVLVEQYRDQGKKEGKKLRKGRKRTCVVPGCGPTNRKVHKIPQNNPLRGIWIQSLGLQSGEVTKSSRICEIHFTESDYVPGRVPGTKCLKPVAVPCSPNLAELWNQNFVHQYQ